MRRLPYLLALLIAPGLAPGQKASTDIPKPTLDTALAPGGTQKAVLAGGCYWGTQGLFEHVKGVKRVVAGYSGGQ
jgi:peptide-methionine (S)-S-oxide reductase